MEIGNQGTFRSCLDDMVRDSLSMGVTFKSEHTWRQGCWGRGEKNVQLAGTPCAKARGVNTITTKRTDMNNRSLLYWAYSLDYALLKHYLKDSSTAAILKRQVLLHFHLIDQENEVDLLESPKWISWSAARPEFELSVFESRIPDLHTWLFSLALKTDPTHMIIYPKPLWPSKSSTMWFK